MFQNTSIGNIVAVVNNGPEKENKVPGKNTAKNLEKLQASFSHEMKGNLLVACEYSGRVRDAFKEKGWNAWSCDLLETEEPGNHWQGDVLEIMGMGWDMMIAHPPCTHLAVSGARHFFRKGQEIEGALKFVGLLLDSNIGKICLENPVSLISSRIRKPSQIIQPWEHGHGETKKTCLWLKGLPMLKPSNVVEGREDRIHKMAPGPNRWRERSRTYLGVAAAMADQWGN